MNRSSDEAMEGIGSARFASRRRPGRGRALFWQPAAQVLWLFCCLGAYIPIAHLYGYSEIVALAQPDAAKLAFAVMALISLSLLLPYRLVGPADYIVVALFDISLPPFYAYWFRADQPWWHGFLVTAYWCVVLLVAQFPFHPRVRHLKGAQHATSLFAWGLVVLGAILIPLGGQLRLWLPLADIYVFRAEQGRVSVLAGYVFGWLAFAVLPWLLAYAWKKKRYGQLAVLGFIAYMLYTSTGMKTYLLMPILVFAVVLIAAWRPVSSLVPVALSCLVATMVTISAVTGSVFWIGIGVYRMFVVPPELTSTYLEFFATHPLIHLAEIGFLKGWVVSPYPKPVAFVIGDFMGMANSNENNGLVTDGFQNFGTVGCLIWALALGILVKLLRVVSERRECIWEAWAVVAMWPIALLSGPLTTSLLTNGLALGLFMVWTLQPSRSADNGSRGQIQTRELRLTSQSLGRRTRFHG